MQTPQFVVGFTFKIIFTFSHLPQADTSLALNGWKLQILIEDICGIRKPSQTRKNVINIHKEKCHVAWENVDPKQWPKFVWFPTVFLLAMLVAFVQLALSSISCQISLLLLPKCSWHKLFCQRKSRPLVTTQNDVMTEAMCTFLVVPLSAQSNLVLTIFWTQCKMRKNCT